MRTFLKASGLIFAVLWTGTSEAATLDRIAATVNEDWIALSEIYDVGAEYLQAAIGTPDLRSAELEVLDTLIQRLLVSQELQNLGMDVTDEEIEGALNDIAQSNNIARSELRSEVEKSGMNWVAYEGEIKESLRQMKFNQLILQPRIVIDENAIQEIYRQVRLQQPDVLQLYGIFLKHPPQTRTAAEVSVALSISVEEAQKRLDEMALQSKRDQEKILAEIQQGLENGIPFRQLAKQYDQSGMAQVEGKMGDFAKGQLRSDLDAAAFALEIGEVSEPLDVGTGLYLLYVGGKGKMEPPPLEDIRPQIMDSYYAERFELEMSTWMETARTRAAIQIHLESATE